MSAPIPPDGPDGPLLARCYDFTTVDALLRAWDAKEVELDDDGFFRTRVSRFDAALPPGAGLR